MATPLHKLKITMTSPGRGSVELDGIPMNAVAVEFRAAVGEMNRAAIVINVGEVEIDGEVDVGIVAKLFATKVNIKLPEGEPK